MSLLTQRGQGRFYERQKEECVVIHFVKIVLQLSLFALVDVLDREVVQLMKNKPNKQLPSSHIQARGEMLLHIFPSEAVCFA